MTLWGCKEMPLSVAVIAVYAFQYPRQPKSSLLQGACLTTARVLSTKALMPKSAILTCPLEFSRMFAGLMSRCTWQSQQKQFSEGEWVGWKPPFLSTKVVLGIHEFCSKALLAFWLLTVCRVLWRYMRPRRIWAQMLDRIRSGTFPTWE